MYLKKDSILQDGKYIIEKILGKGGFGITYLAIQPSLGRKVAIKEFFMDDFCNRECDGSVTVPSPSIRPKIEKYRCKFIKEARIMASLEHPHIAPIVDVFEENGTAYYVMKYYSKGSLSNLIKPDGALSELVALRYIKQVASALDYVHGNKYMHLDIKPDNVLIDDQNNAILIDFGIAKHYDENGLQTTHSAGALSCGYAPIEQYMDGGVIVFSPSTDIYALGAMFFKMLTGVTPPQASEVMNNGLPELPIEISPVIRNAINAAMQPKREDRPQNIAEFLEYLSYDNEIAVSVKKIELERRIELLLKYAQINAYKEDRAVVVRSVNNVLGKKKYGFIDKSGNEVVPCVYDNAMDYSNGLAGVKVNDKWGYVDNKGINVIPCKYDEVKIFSEGRAAVKLNNKWGIIDTKGNVITQFKYDYCASLADGLSLVGYIYKTDIIPFYKYGYVDKDGVEVIQCKYNFASDFSEGLASVSFNYKFGYINKNGDVLIPFVYENARSFSDGLAAVSANGKYGFINRQGETIIPFKYDDAGIFNEGFVTVAVGDRYGFIDKKGKVMVQCLYDETYDYINGFAIVDRSNKFGYVDKTGLLITNCVYDMADFFYNGKAMVRYVNADNGNLCFGFIDDDGVEDRAPGQYINVSYAPDLGLVKAVDVNGVVHIYDTEVYEVYCNKKNIDESTRSYNANENKGLEDVSYKPLNGKNSNNNKVSYKVETEDNIFKNRLCGTVLFIMGVIFTQALTSYDTFRNFDFDAFRLSVVFIGFSISFAMMFRRVRTKRFMVITRTVFLVAAIINLFLLPMWNQSLTGAYIILSYLLFTLLAISLFVGVKPARTLIADSEGLAEYNDNINEDTYDKTVKDLKDHQVAEASIKKNKKMLVIGSTVVLLGLLSVLFCGILFSTDYKASDFNYIDLGLPSGLKWADCNAGATAPEGFGDYLEWDKVNSCGLRIPTNEEFQELINHCTWEWTMQNGISGYKVIGSNGNSIFFASSGFYIGTPDDPGGEYFYKNKSGFYWTSTLMNNYSDAYYLFFSNKEIEMQSRDRFYMGFSVRPVSQ